MNREKYCRYMLKQCANPKRSVAVMLAWGIIPLILGMSSIFLVNLPMIHTRWETLVADLFVGGALTAIGLIYLKHAFIRRLTLEFMDQEKMRKTITEQGTGTVR